MQTEHVDVLVIGAGLSGIGAAHQLTAAFPRRTVAVLEAREALGGTWDLFRYPGIRSDSDMHTLGYRFRPWHDPQAIADGPSILRYLQDVAQESGVDRLIRYRHTVVGADWSTADNRWTVEVLRTDPATGEEERVTMTCWFLFCCSGYYRYDEGYTPDFPGIGFYRGQVVHPQHWPENLDTAGKRVVVIGSGATAVTLVPALADRGAHVTMLQRSPTYIVALPGRDPIAGALHRHLPERVVPPLVRWKNIALQTLSYQFSRRRPERMKSLLRKGLVGQLPAGYDIDTHFTPSYDPWDQRLCVVPDADLFRAISDGSATVVTDHIERFTETGILLRSGQQLDADVVVTATGLNLLLFGGLRLSLNGEPVELTAHMAYKGMMLSDIPNFAFAVGYTNASWTLKVDLVYEYLIRLFRYMDAHGHSACAPRRRDDSVTEQPFMDFSAGYVLRALDRLPKQGSKAPWRLRMNYAVDLVTLRFGRIDDGVMDFADAPTRLSSSSSIAAA